MRVLPLRLTGVTATLLYAAGAVAMTWPLATGLARDIPWDLGDSVLNCWILAWTASRFVRILTGDFSAATGFWNANIYYPEPLTLAYSEHLAAQAVQILPVYVGTGNLVLSYNLLFLSTYVLSGLGTFLLVRDLTGSARAGFVAGLFYAFAPYRVAQSTHLQVLSSQWMPFVLYGFRRYFETGRLASLVGATVALIAQNLSCGYYLLFFTPFVPLYCTWELWTRGRLRDVRAWAGVAAAGIATGVATWPFLSGYREFRRIGHEPRAISEVIGFSADVYSYFTSTPDLWIWGDVARAFVKAEGELFPGAVPPALALIGIAWQVSNSWRRIAVTPAVRSRDRALRLLAILAGAFAIVKIVTVIAIATGYGGVTRVGPIAFRMSNFYNEIWRVLAAAVILLVSSKRARLVARDFASSPAGWFAFAALIALWLSLGPLMHTMGRRIAPGPYLYLYEYAPGFDGLRVPARFGMIATLFLAVLGGIACAFIERRRSWSGIIVAALGGIFLIEGAAIPIRINIVAAEPGLRAPSPRLRTGEHIPEVYRFVETLPPDAVLVEFPFGTAGHDLQYMYYSTFHWRRLLNGYSGFFPRSFSVRQAQFGRFREEPETATRALALSGASHAIVHETAYRGQEAEAVIAWLEASGARRVKAFGRDILFDLGRR